VSAANVRDLNPVLAAAREYVARGWQPLALPPKSKVIKVTGWQERRLTLEDLPREFSNLNSNIGILLGEASGGLYDVDIDCVEALAVADAFLPTTGAEFGRKSKPRSHRFYICTGIDGGTRKFPDITRKKDEEQKDEKSMLIELRSSGGQTMVPPSVHPFGEAVEWASSAIAPAEITYPELLRAIQLTAAALLVRYYPLEGLRNDAALALAGALLRGGFSLEQSELFLATVARAANDEEAASRTATVRATAAKIANNEPTTGGPTVAELFGDKVWGAVRTWLGLIGRPADPELDARPRVICKVDNLPWVTDEAVDVLAKAPERWGYFQHANSLVRVTALTPEDVEADKQIRREAGAIILERATIAGIEDDATRAIGFQKYRIGPGGNLVLV